MELMKELEPRGDKSSPIWLIGDSDPKKSGHKLNYVFDDRHPVINNIWTPIIYRIQKRIFEERKQLVDDTFYMINPISDSQKKPGKHEESYRYWDSESIGTEKSEYLVENMEKIKKLIKKLNPKMLLTFGKFSFEFIRRCEGKGEEPLSKWDTKGLRVQFVESINKEEKIVPLLHRSISSGNFLVSHKLFSSTKNVYNEDGNYFDFVSENLYRRIIKLLL